MREGGQGKEESSRRKWSESTLWGLFHTGSLQICITKCAYVPAYSNGLKKERGKTEKVGREGKGEREEWTGMQEKVEAAA